LTDLDRLTYLFGVVLQLVALGLAPSSAFLAIGHILQKVEREEGSLGEPNVELTYFLLGLCSPSDLPPPDPTPLPGAPHD